MKQERILLVSKKSYDLDSIGAAQVSTLKEAKSILRNEPALRVLMLPLSSSLKISKAVFELLQMTPSDCRVILVGKKITAHQYSQLSRVAKIFTILEEPNTVRVKTSLQNAMEDWSKNQQQKDFLTLVE